MAIEKKEEIKEEQQDQIIFPSADFLKKGILETREQAFETLRAYRWYNRTAEDHGTWKEYKGSGDNQICIVHNSKSKSKSEARRFITFTIELYQHMRSSIICTKKLDEKFSKLKEIDKYIVDSGYDSKAIKVNMKKWIDYFNLLDELLYIQGLSKLALDRELIQDGLRRR